MRLKPRAISAQVGKRRPTRAKNHGRVPPMLGMPTKRGPARQGAGNTIVNAGNQPVIAAAQAATGPIALHVDGHLVGLALKIDARFLFFSAGHRTDDFDRQIFTSLADIRDALGDAPVFAGVPA
jgi:hypothetical protein